MRSRPVLLFMVWGVILQAKVLQGQESPVTDNPPIVSESSDNRLNRLFEMVDQPEHDGLLGKRYFSERYLGSRISNRYAGTVGANYDLESSLNLPIMSFDASFPVNVDLFMDYDYAGNLWRDRPYGPTWTSHIFTIGTVFHTSVTDRFRPFFRIGYYTESQRVVGLYGPWDNNYRNRQFDLIPFEPGFEFDFLESLSYRLSASFNNRNLSHPRVLNELVAWPTDRFFVRSGLGISTYSSKILLSLGVGFTF